MGNEEWLRVDGGNGAPYGVFTIYDDLSGTMQGGFFLREKPLD